MAEVNVFQKKVKLQGQDHDDKNYGTMWKVISQGIHTCNMKALSLLLTKLWPMLKFFQSRSNFKVKVTRSKLWYHVKGLVTKNTHVQYESPITSGKKVMAKVKVFSKVGQTSRSMSRGQKLWYQVKGLVTRNTHVQYESHITSGKKVMSKVKVFVHAHTPTRTLGLWH